MRWALGDFACAGRLGDYTVSRALRRDLILPSTTGCVLLPHTHANIFWIFTRLPERMDALALGSAPSLSRWRLPARWDYSCWPSRNDFIVEISENVIRPHVRKTYRRGSLSYLRPGQGNVLLESLEPDFALICVRACSFNRLESAIRAFPVERTQLGGGDGPEFQSFDQAGDALEVLRRLSDSNLREPYARCRAISACPGRVRFPASHIEPWPLENARSIALGIGRWKPSPFGVSRWRFLLIKIPRRIHFTARSV